MPRAPIRPRQSFQPCVSLEYSPHAVGSKLSRKQPPPTSTACTAVHESRCSDASARAVPLPTPTARSPLVVCSVLKCCRQCRWPLSSCSHHWPAYLPNAGIERGGEHGSFMRGDEASSSMKGCSLCMYLRCVRATRASARDISSTLPARRVDLSRFTRSVGRMYPLSSNASCDSIRVLTGP